MAVYLKRNSDLRFISEYMEESQRLESMVRLSLIRTGYEVSSVLLHPEVLLSQVTR